MSESLPQSAWLPQWWSERSLQIARCAAIGAVATVPFSTALTSLSALVLLVAWLSSGQAHRLLADALRQPLGAALAVFFAVLALGMLYSAAEWNARLDALWSWRKLAYTVILLPLFAAERWKRAFLVAFLAVAGAALVASLPSWLGWVPPHRPGDEPGVVLQNHATQGMVFALALLCCHQLARGASRRVHVGLLALGALFALNVVFVTAGRSGYVALAVVLATIGISQLGWRRAPLVAIIVVVLGGLALSASSTMRERIALGVKEATQFDPAAGYSSLGFRRVAFENTFELISRAPILGHGTGSFLKVYSAHVAAKYQDWRAERAWDPHNQYLFIAFENGVIGLAAFVAFLVAAFATRGVASRYRWIALGALAAWILTSLFSSHFKTFPEGHLIGLFLGAMLAGRARRASAEDTA